jgi:membrane fusion protein, heavy metal efflux system
MKATLPRRYGLPITCLVAAILLFIACSGRTDQTAGDTKASKAITEAPSEGTKCSEHGAPKELCFICDASLRDKDRPWCNEHNRYEDRCWECHPELRDPNRLWCEEHALYEDECFLCHPELLGKDSKPAGGKGGETAGNLTPAAAAVLMCKEHGVPEQECGICHPDLLGKQQPGHGLKVRLPSAESAAKAGIAIGNSTVDRMQQGIECLAELTFNQNKLAQITPMVGGVVKSVDVDLGSRVGKGALLARITSAAISEAQSAYRRALAEEQLRDKTVERERSLRAKSISSERDLQEAEAAYQTATAEVQQTKQQLLVFGFDEQQIRALPEQEGAPGILEIRAPFAGEIVERAAVQGALAEAGKPLFTLADTAALWAMVNIPESQLPRARVGQKVQLTVESLPGQTFEGKLTWLPAQVEERTRMARARVEVANRDGRLKAQMFARALIVTSDSEGAVVVPQSALQNVTGTTLVFVKSGEDLFEARPVQLGAKRNGYVEIVAGLRPGEPVVIAGSFALKSQFLISRLGAGCVD